MPPALNRTMNPLEWGLLLTLALLWGGSYFYNAIAVQALPPLTIVTVRVSGGAILLYALVRGTGRRMPSDPAIWLAFFIMGLLNTVIPFNLIAWAQSHVASGPAAILNATTPLFAVVFANYLTADEHMTMARLGGVIIGFVGAVVMIGPDALEGLSVHVVAELGLLLASIAYALSPIYARRFARAGVSPMVAAAGQFIAASATMIPLTLVVDRPWTLAMPGPGVWAALFALAALSTALAYVIYYRILSTAGAVNLMLVTFLVPVSAILLGTLFLNEQLGLNHLAGMTLIGLGLAAIDGRPLRVLRRRIA